MWAGYDNLKENVHLNSKAVEMGDDRKKVDKDSPGSGPSPPELKLSTGWIVR